MSQIIKEYSTNLQVSTQLFNTKEKPKTLTVEFTIHNIKETASSHKKNPFLITLPTTSWKYLKTIELHWNSIKNAASAVIPKIEPCPILKVSKLNLST